MSNFWLIILNKILLVFKKPRRLSIIFLKLKSELSKILWPELVERRVISEYFFCIALTESKDIKISPIFLYINGQYELSIEDTGTSTFSITDDHIIADAGISVDYGNKDKKANKVVVEFFNANKKYELDTITVLHDATPYYYSDDNDEVLEIKAEFPYVNDPYIAYNMGKAILTRSRNQTTMQFLGTPEMYKLNVGDIVDLTYAPLNFSGKVCRVEALELQAQGLVAVSLIEYFDVYTWEVPDQEPEEELANLPSAYAVKAPTGLSFTDTGSSSTGRPFLSWDEPTDFPDYQYRVNVVDSSSNQVLNKIVDVTNADLNFLPVGTDYVASVSSLNTLDSESDPSTLTFSVADEPVDGGVDIKANTITGTQINVDVLNVKHFDDVSADIKSHLATETFVPLSREGQAYVQRTGTYTGSNASFIPVTITEVRNNATYVAIFSGVLGDVSGGRVQYSLNNSTWVNANGNTNISWSAGTYRGYTYVYTGQITTLSDTQSTVYWRVYFSGSYNHTQLSLNVMMDNTQ